MNYPKLFSQKSLLVSLMAALFAVGLGVLPAQAQPFANVANIEDNTVSVLDVAGNTVSPVESKLTLKFNMQACSKPGPVTVELRSGTSPYDLVESVNGTGGGNVAAVFSFGKAADGEPYYVVVKSVNSIETWSATKVTFDSTSHAASYDFTTATSQAYGGNQISSNGIPSIYQGDTNQDGIIDLNDIIAVSNDSSNFATKPSTDFNCDGVTDLTDTLLTYNNSKNFIRVEKPD